MTVNQVYSILNSVASQMYGSSAIAVTNTADFYSLGQTVSGDVDKFLGVLVDRIGKTVIRTLDVSLDFPGIMRDNFSFGALLQKITIDPFQAKETNSWKVGDVGFTPSLYDISKPSVSVTYFKDVATFEFDVTIPDTLFKTAFDSESQMAAFISGIMDTMEKSMTMHINFLTRGVVCGMIGEKLDLSSYVDLLTLYNNDHTPTLSADEALESPDFLKYAGRIIRNYIEYMANPSVLYNEGSKVRATPRDNMHVLMSTAFTSSYVTNYQSGVYWEQMVSLPYYTEVNFWQGSGNTAPTDADCTKVHVYTKNGDEVESGYVIGVLADRQAIATGLYDRFSAADRSNRDRFTNFTEGASLQHMVDLSENIVVFTLGAPTVTPATP